MTAHQARRRRRPPLAGALAVAVAVLLAGCGGGDGEKSANGPVKRPRQQAGAPGPSGSPPPGERLELVADNFVLTAGPETAGFASRSRSADDYVDTVDQEFADCLGVEIADLADVSTETAFGDEFTDSSGLTLASVAAMVPAGTVERDRRILALPDYPRCLAESAVRASVAAGLPTELVSAQRGPELPGVMASVSMVLRVVVSLPDGGDGRPGGDDGAVPVGYGRPAAGRAISTLLYYDQYFVAQDEVETTVHVTSYGLAADETLVRPAVAQVVDKVSRQA
ncbi:MAG: hypothetical protein IRZ08_15725 [Frankia sp.]|nr:hypothetical protein [Frankia sp.]